MGCKSSMDSTKVSSCNTEEANLEKQHNARQLHQVVKPEFLTRRRYTDKRPK